MVQNALTILHNYIHLPPVANHDDQNDIRSIPRGRTTISTLYWCNGVIQIDRLVISA